MPKPMCDTHEDGVSAVRNADFHVRQGLARLKEASGLLDPSVSAMLVGVIPGLSKASMELWKTMVKVQETGDADATAND